MIEAVKPTPQMIRAHWDRQASKGNKAGTQDLILKQLEQRVILKELRGSTPRLILEVGCGTGDLARMALEACEHSLIDAIDSSLAMIEAAQSHHTHPGIDFMVGDVLDLPRRNYCDVYSERCLINLRSWEEQKAAIDGIAERLIPRGRFLMCEHSQDGLEAINAERARVDLPAIPRPWHNRYFHHDELQTITSLKLIATIPFSAAYYFLSRVINAKLSADKGEEPDYDSPINRLALTLPYSSVDPKFAQGRLWIWEKP